jgi:hypothetical protein
MTYATARIEHAPNSPPAHGDVTRLPTQAGWPLLYKKGRNEPCRRGRQHVSGGDVAAPSRSVQAPPWPFQAPPLFFPGIIPPPSRAHPGPIPPPSRAHPGPIPGPSRAQPVAGLAPSRPQPGNEPSLLWDKAMDAAMSLTAPASRKPSPSVYEIHPLIPAASVTRSRSGCCRPCPQPPALHPPFPTAISPRPRTRTMQAFFSSRRPIGASISRDSSRTIAIYCGFGPLPQAGREIFLPDVRTCSVLHP